MVRGYRSAGTFVQLALILSHWKQGCYWFQVSAMVVRWRSNGTVTILQYHPESALTPHRPGPKLDT
jgi:anthranilate/para-aminobenzoate synthase component II